MKLATHRTTTVPRKGPTIVQEYKKKLEYQAKEAASREQERLREIATRDHLGITTRQYRQNMHLYFSLEIRRWDELKKRRLAQALQGPQLPALPVPAGPLPDSKRKWYKELFYFICR